MISNTIQDTLVHEVARLLKIEEYLDAVESAFELYGSDERHTTGIQPLI